MDRLSTKASTGVRRKDNLRRALKARNYDTFSNGEEEPKGILRPLSSLLFDNDPLIRWRAAEGLGYVSKIIIKNNPDAVRRQIRRLFWLMNDESGGLCWMAPEAIGEILIHCPELIEEYTINLFSFMDEEPFEAGIRWDVYRLINGSTLSEYIKEKAFVHKDKVIKSLNHPKPGIRGNGILAMNALQLKIDKKYLDSLLSDNELIDYYDIESGALESIAVKDLLAKK